MTTLQIITNQNDWDASILQSVGRVDAATGRAINPTSTQLIAKDLPETQYITWRGVVDQLRAAGGGEWDCVNVDASKHTQAMYAETEGETETTQEVIILRLSRSWTDGTTDTDTLVLDAAPVIEFFNWFTTR